MGSWSAFQSRLSRPSNPFLADWASRVCMKTIQLTPTFALHLGEIEPEAFIPPEERLEWCNALLSGEHQQGVHYLYNISRNTKCCLGVKHILEKTPYVTRREQEYPITGNDALVAVFNNHSACYQGSCAAITPPGRFPEGTTFYPRHYKTLSGLNDTGIPFSVIALVINTIWCSETWRPYYVPPASILL